MNKRIPTFALAISMIFSSVIFSNFAQAVSKPTFACKKVGQTAKTNGYQFTCIKSGKKIIWNNGVKIAPTSGTSAASALPKPSPSATKESASTTTSDSSQENLLGKTCTDLGSEKTTFYLWICVEVKDKGKIWIRKGTESEYQIISSNQANSSQSNTQTQSNIPVAGSPCNVFGQKINTNFGYMLCVWRGGYDLGWNSIVVPKLSNSQQNNYKQTPVQGGKCEQSGDTYNVSNGYLECRFVNGGSLQWILVNSLITSYVNATSPNGVDVCKLQNSAVPAKAGRSAGQTAGFPTIARDTFINPGVNEAIVVGVDFPELRGNDTDLATVNAYDRKMINEWYSYFSNGKVTFNLNSYDHWIHMSQSAKSFSISGTFDMTGANSNAILGNLAQKFVDVINKEVDLSNYKTVYMIFPQGEFTFDTDLIVRNHSFNTNQGVRNMNFFGWNKDLEFMGTLHWPFYVHESLHDAVLIGHAPGNGWPFSVMTNQSGISYSPFSWEQFQLGWLPDNQIFCVSNDSLVTSKVSLSPMEREDKQTKSIIVKISATKAIVVEAHGIEKWSDFKTYGREYPPGFHGVMAYLVDLENAGAPPVAADGRAIQDDTGNSPSYPRWAYWQPIDGGASFKGNWNFRNSSVDYNNYIAMLGDSFTIEGVKIKVVGTGDYETVEISKA